MSAAIPWDRLEKQYSSMNAYRDELVQMIKTDNNAFRAGNVLSLQFGHYLLTNQELLNWITM